LSAATPRVYSGPDVKTLPGIYTEENFLGRATCEALKASMRAGRRERARVYERGAGYAVNESRRSAIRVSVDEGFALEVGARLRSKCEEFSRRFGVEVKDCDEPTFLAYGPGDFFEPHKDYTGSPNAPDFVSRRRVSAVVFLGDEGADGDYEGGSLAFHVLGDERLRHIGLPVRGRAGLLVAFRSDVLHQVSPVERGERFTVVTWFF